MKDTSPKKIRKSRWSVDESERSPYWTEKKENPYRKLLLISVRTKTEPVTYIKIVASKAQTENKERMKSTPKESKDSQRRSDCAAKDLHTIRQTCREVHEDGRTRGREMKPLTCFSRTERNIS